MIKQDNNTFVGQLHFHFSKLNSTNKFLQEFGDFNNDRKSFVISIDYQTNGVGQRGSFWESEPGENLLFSMFSFYQYLKINQTFAINKMVSISILTTLVNLGIENVKIKWPNDILIGDEKIAGILIENSIQGEKVKSLIIGIGLNINQLKFKDYKRKCTSLKKVKGIEFSRFDILEKLKKTIETNFSKLKNDFTAFDREYLENLYQFNVWKGYLIYNQRKNACIKGVSFGGDLEVKIDSEEILSLKNKEIVFI